MKSKEISHVSLSPTLANLTRPNGGGIPMLFERVQAGSMALAANRSLLGKFFGVGLRPVDAAVDVGLRLLRRSFRPSST